MNSLVAILSLVPFRWQPRLSLLRLPGGDKLGPVRGICMVWLGFNFHASVEDYRCTQHVGNPMFCDNLIGI